MVPKEVLLDVGLVVLGLANSVWFRMSKYSARNWRLDSRQMGKERMTAPSQLVKPGPRSEPLTTLPKPVPGPLWMGTEKAALLSQLTQDLPTGQSPEPLLSRE